MRHAAVGQALGWLATGCGLAALALIGAVAIRVEREALLVAEGRRS